MWWVMFSSRSLLIYEPARARRARRRKVCVIGKPSPRTGADEPLRPGLVARDAATPRGSAPPHCHGSFHTMRFGDDRLGVKRRPTPIMAGQGRPRPADAPRPSPPRRPAARPARARRRRPPSPRDRRRAARSRPQVARPAVVAPVGGVERRVAVVAAVDTLRRPPRRRALVGRGSCRRGCARRPAIASRAPAPSRGIEVEVAEEHQWRRRRGRPRAPASSRSAAPSR